MEERKEFLGIFINEGNGISPIVVCKGNTEEEAFNKVLKKAGSCVPSGWFVAGPIDNLKFVKVVQANPEETREYRDKRKKDSLIRVCHQEGIISLERRDALLEELSMPYHTPDTTWRRASSLEE